MASLFIQSNKRIALIGLLILVLGFLFWTGSRYPSLNEKAFMGGDTMLEDSLSFESILELQEGDPLWQEIAYTTLNWINTNMRGMAFGIMLGAAFLSAIRMFRQRSVRSSFGNTLLGMVLGAPLGVCVNCAAPVAKGMHDGGARLETTLSAMVSSPTLNVIVVTMTFSILPTYLAITKLAFTLLFILAIIPLLARTALRSELVTTIENATCDLQAPPLEIENDSWFAGVLYVARDFLSSLWYIVRTTVPLMLLAGFLGSVVAVLLPLSSLAEIGPVWLGSILLAVVGLFLPVPVAFDVVLSAILLAAGLPVLYVMILLFVLGIFSCYSAFIVATTISKRAAAVLCGVLVVMGLIAGVTADMFHTSELRGMVQGFGKMQSVTGLATAGIPQALIPDLPSSEVSVETTTPAQVTIHRSDYQPASAAGDRAFTRFDGDSLGIESPKDFSVEDFWPPFYNGRGIASADMNNDGWVDVIAGTENGPQLYLNEEGKRFSVSPLDFVNPEELNTFVVAPVDLDNDGWLDILFSTYRNGVYYILNNAGRFNGSELYRVPTGDSVITQGIAFGDVDRDGDLDGVFGNWFYGGTRGTIAPPTNSENFLYQNERGQLIPKKLSGITGDTLAVQLTDWNGDGQLDLIVANDFDPPDIFYTGNGDGTFTEIYRQDKMIPISPAQTMSIDTADIDNDLKVEIYLTNIAARPTSGGRERVGPEMPLYCSDIIDTEARQACEANMPIRGKFAFGGAHQPSHITNCDIIPVDDPEHGHCQAMMLMKTAILERDIELCDYIPKSEARSRFLCEIFFLPESPGLNSQYMRAIPQTRARNVLLSRHEDTWVNRAEELEASTTGWSWGGKFADLDNDSWQDIYVVNGTWLRPSKVPSNVYFWNRGGAGFEDRTDESGVEDYLVVSAFTYADIENDGDLDIITNSVNGPFRIYRNNETQNPSITVELRDHRGNRFGIGSQITIHYDERRRHQIREIKSGSGFLSFDEPAAHFGLGEFESVDQIDILWSTGESTTHEGPFSARGRYRIERR